MKTNIIIIALILVSSLSFNLASANQSTLEIELARLDEAIPGKINLNTRVRYEVFDQENVPRRSGSNARIRMGYTTPSLEGFQAMIEGESIIALSHPSQWHPLDQAGRDSEWNQVWLRYQHGDFGHVRLGRQIYTLDNHRFIGHVGWRQNIQTFDAITTELKPTKATAINLFYIDRVQRVDGSRENLDGWGINVAHRWNDQFQSTVFYYRLEFDQRAAWSADTLGILLRAHQNWDNTRIQGVFSYAIQEDNSASLSPTGFSLDYWALDLSATQNGITFGAGMEILDGDGTNGFRTPLATVHQFNGFADVFLPIGGLSHGLRDFHIYIAGKIPVGNGIQLRAVYHQFESHRDNTRLGKEYDLVASYTINKHLNLVTKYGNYRSRGPNPFNYGHLDKKMFTAEINFNY